LCFWRPPTSAEWKGPNVLHTVNECNIAMLPDSDVQELHSTDKDALNWL